MRTKRKFRGILSRFDATGALKVTLEMAVTAMYQAVFCCQVCSMSKGCYHLGEITAIRLYCPECHRFAQFKRASLLKRFGPDKPMPTMLRDLKPCNIGNSLSGPQCQLDAMTPEARAEARAKGGLPGSWT